MSGAERRAEGQPTAERNADNNDGALTSRGESETQSVAVETKP